MVINNYGIDIIMVINNIVASELMNPFQFWHLHPPRLLAAWQRLRPLPWPQRRQRQWQALSAAASLAVLLGAMMFQMGRLGGCEAVENPEMPGKTQ